MIGHDSRRSAFNRLPLATARMVTVKLRRLGFLAVVPGGASLFFLCGGSQRRRHQRLRSRRCSRIKNHAEHHSSRECGRPASNSRSKFSGVPARTPLRLLYYPLFLKTVICWDIRRAAPSGRGYKRKKCECACVRQVSSASRVRVARDSRRAQLRPDTARPSVVATCREAAAVAPMRSCLVQTESGQSTSFPDFRPVIVNSIISEVDLRTGIICLQART